MSLNYMLDTNICIYIAKEQPLNVLHKFEQLKVGEAAMSTITYGELFFGASKSHHPKKSLHMLQEITSFIPVLPIPIEAGKYYGEIRKKLMKEGRIIGNNDLWIAGHTLALDVTLVSNNLKEFSRIPSIKIENWVEA